MNDVRVIAIVHENNDAHTVEGFITTEMTHDDYITHINRMRREMARLEMECENLLSMVKTLERQRDRLLREKYAMIEEELKTSYSCGLLRRR